MEEDFDKFMDRIEQILGRLFGGGNAGTDNREDPATFTRAVNLSEAGPKAGNILMALEQAESIKRRGTRAAQEAKAYWGEMTAARERIYMMLEETFPEIAAKESPDQEFCGIRRWRGAWWYISQDKDDAPTNAGKTGS